MYLELNVLQLHKLRSQVTGTGQRKRVSDCSKNAKQNNFFIDDFIKSIETPEEVIEVFNQLEALPSQHGFELKK